MSPEVVVKVVEVIQADPLQIKNLVAEIRALKAVSMFIGLIPRKCGSRRVYYIFMSRCSGDNADWRHDYCHKKGFGNRTIERRQYYDARGHYIWIVPAYVQLKDLVMPCIAVPPFFVLRI